MGKERGVEKKEKNGGTSTRSKDEDAEERQEKKRPSLILSYYDSDELLLSASKKVDYGKNEVRIFSSSENENDVVEDEDKDGDKNDNANKKRKYVDRTRILRSDAARNMEVSTDNGAAVQLPVEKKRITEPSDDLEVPLKKFKAGLSRTRREKATGSFSNALINGDVRKEMKEENAEDFGTSDVDRTGIQCLVENRKNIKLKRSANKLAEKIHSVEQPSSRTLLKLDANKRGGHKSEDTSNSPHKDGVLRVQGKGGVLKILRNHKTSNGLENSQAERGDERNSNVSGSSRITRASLKQTYLSQDREDDEKLSKKGTLVKDQELEVSSLSHKVSSIKRKMVTKVVSPQRGSKKLNKLDGISKLPACTRPETNKSGGDASSAKRKIREQIKDILLNAGWKIDLRPRNGRNYLDSVYIPPDGPGSYWSITKAYSVYQEKLNDGNIDKRKKQSAKSSKTSSGNSSGASLSSSLLPIESLNMLKRVVNKRRSKEELEESKRGKKRKIKASMKKENLKSYHSKSKLDGIVKRKRSKDHLDLCTTAPPKVHKHLQTGKTKRKGCTLLARDVNQESETNCDDYFQYDGKRTVLSWMIDMGVLLVNGKVNYMNNKRTKPKLEGCITRDGIHCGCCSKILPIAKFELHAGSKVRPASEHIYVKDSGVSLLDCQLNAWKKQDESEKLGFYTIDVSGDDPNDDTCGICGDGGDLICCDGCPSTFHLSCLGIQRLPPGDWNCSNCSCRFCGEVSKHGDQELEEALSPLFSCSQCEEKYHQNCVPESDYFSLGRSNSGPSFCGQTCRKMFRRLQKLLGVINDLDEGFSWSLVRRLDDGMIRSSFRLAQRAECNSKVAVALEVMDECFLPIIDERSGANLIHNVVYNCGSNFNRLDYKGFYTFILERDDEIISAASVRIHGARLAEMPFIGTRNMYRRQGMCRRLLDGIETALRSLNVERLVIPAISELKDTWTNVFGFKPLEVSQDLDIRSINMLVFPGTGLLQKLLLKKGQDVKGDEVAAVDCNREDGLTLKTACESVKLSASGANGHDADQVVVYHKVGDAGSCLPHVGCVDSTSNISPAADILQNSGAEAENKASASGANGHDSDQVVVYHKVGDAGSCLSPVGCVDSTSNIFPVAVILQKSGAEAGNKAHLVDDEAYLQSNPDKISCDELIGEGKRKVNCLANEMLTECKVEGECSSETGFAFLMLESWVNNEVLPLKVASIRESQVTCLEGVSCGSGDLFGGKSQTSETGTSQDSDFHERPSVSATNHVTNKKCHLLGPDSVECSNPPLVESVISSNHSHRLGETFIQPKTSDGGGQFKDVACELDSLSHSCRSPEILGKLQCSDEIDPSTPDPRNLNPYLTGSKEDEFAVQEDPEKSPSQLTAATYSLGDEVSSAKPVHPCALSAINSGSDMVNKIDMAADSARDTL